MLRRRFGDSPLRRVVGNALILLGGKSVSAVFSLGYLALAVRALGPEAFGVLVMIHAYTAFIGEVAKFQSWQAVLRYGTPALEEGRPGDLQRLIKFTGLLDVGSAFGATLLAAAGVLLAAPVLDWPDEIVPMAMIYSLSLLFIASATPSGLLRLFDRFDILAVQTFIESLVRLVGAALAFVLGWGLPAFLLIWFGARMIAGLVLFAGAFVELRRRDLLKGMSWRLRGLRKPFPGLWRFVLATNFTTTAATSMAHLAPLVVGGVLGASEAGLFRIAHRLGEALAKPTKMLIPAIYPEIARMVSRDQIGQLRHLLKRTAAISAGGAAAALAVLVLAGPWLLALIGGSQAVTAYELLVLLGLAALLAMIAFSLEPTLISIGRAGTALQAQLAGAAVHLVLIVLLTKLWGLVGAGAAALAATLVMVAARLVPVIRWFRGRQRTAKD